MTISVDVRNGIAHAVLDAPPLNVLTSDVLADVRDALSRLEGDRTLRVLLFTARGKHFSAGASVEEHLPGRFETMIPDFMRTVLAVERFPAPVVFGVHGRCLGGAMELVLAGDLIVAAESARFGVPEILLGVLPPAACVQLAARVPPAVAAELIFTGATIDAGRAHALGLVARVVPDEALSDTAHELAATLGERSAAALRAAKRALHVGRGDPSARMDEVTRIYLEELMSTRDAVEGLEAFQDKRPPEWSHA